MAWSPCGMIYDHVCHVMCYSWCYLLSPHSSQEAKISSTCMRTLIFLVKPVPKKAPPVQTPAQKITDDSKEGEKGEQTVQEEESSPEVSPLLIHES